MGADTTMSKAGRASAGKLAMRWTVRVIKLLALVFVLATSAWSSAHSKTDALC